MHWLVTGGAGFIGANAAAQLLARGDVVTIVDDLSRPGAAANLEWLRALGPIDFQLADVSRADEIEAVFAGRRGVDVVLHLAGQVAVTTSVRNPRRDFEVNALGMVNVLEAVRRHAPAAILLNASTNKVYGGMEDLRVTMRGDRYEFQAAPQGIAEDRPLDFHSPYGCSKGAADQYVLDYARIFGLRTVSLRQSCIYGPRQFGLEDQGWVAWFAISAVAQRPVTVYGDGRQVRDVLHVDDLVDCYLAAVEGIDRAAGRCYNIGGGPANTLSLLELLDMLEGALQRPISRVFAEPRSGDQRVFVADIRRAAAELCWAPRISKNVGIPRLLEWVRDNAPLFTATC